MKLAVDAYATTLTCLVEFNSIEQALAIQDEADREDMQLLGKGKRLKVAEMQATSPQSFKTIGSELNALSVKPEMKTGFPRGVSFNSGRTATTQR